MSHTTSPCIGICACLLAHPVAFDGGHRRQRSLIAPLIEHVCFVPLCMEKKIGLGAPRPVIQLPRIDDHVMRVNGRQPRHAPSRWMSEFPQSDLGELSDLDGFILKQDSSSRGHWRLPDQLDDGGYRERSGVDLFALEFTRHWPLIPVEDEGRLNDHAIRETFFERVFALRRWKESQQTPARVHDLMDFHARHKLQLMARGGDHYRRLGNMIAGTTKATLETRRQAYILEFMQVMRARPTRGHHVNVLQHIQGYFIRVLLTWEKQELQAAFQAFRERQLPLIAPINLLRHHLRTHRIPYLSSQHYFAPFPDALALRSWI